MAKFGDLGSKFEKRKQKILDSKILKLRFGSFHIFGGSFRQVSDCFDWFWLILAGFGSFQVLITTVHFTQFPIRWLIAVD